MEWYPITTLATALINATLAVVLYKRGNHKGENALSAYLLIAVAFWCFGSFMVNIAKTPEMGLLWNRLLHVGAIMVPPLFIHFIWEFSKTKKKRSIVAIILMYIASIYFLLLVFDPEFIINIEKAKFIGYSFEPGPKYIYFAIFYALSIISGIALLGHAYKSTEGYKHQQIKYFFISLVIAIISSLMFFFQAISLYQAPPFDNILIIIFSATFSYAMLTYRLVDFKLIVGKVVLFIIYFAAMAIFFTAISTGIMWLIFREVITKHYLITFLTATIPFMIFSIAFPPLRTGIMQYVDVVVYGKDYSYREVIKNTSEALVQILDLRELLGFLTDTISHNIKPSRLYLFLREGDFFNVRACSGVISSSQKLATESPLVDYMEKNIGALLAWEFENKHPELKKIIAALKRLHAEAIVPLYVKDRLTGFLALDAKKSGKNYSPQDMEILNAIATNAAIALQNAHLYQEAITDGLTGLYHHKYFQTRIREELDRAIEYRYPLSVIMLDIDFFKKVNDTHGHQIGDQVLQEIAATITKNMRLFDITARYGGEEFAILLPAMGEESAAQHYNKAVAIAERLRQEIEESALSEKKLKITVSLGVAFFDGKDDTMNPRTLISEADEQLYKAKKSGRNKVCNIDLSKKRDISSRLAI